MADLSMPARLPGRSPRRLVAVGIIRRTPGRTTAFTATEAGVTGRITATAVTR